MALPLIAGAAIVAGSQIIGNAMQAQQEAENAERLAEASRQQLEAYRQAYDQAYGPGTFNAKMQSMGSSAADNYSRIVNNPELWDRYINGSEAYRAPEAFEFTAEDLYSDPSYQFRLKQGQDALSQNQVAGGLNLSGAVAKQMNDYTQNVAVTEYANAYKRANDQYNTDRQFDFNAWLTNANQYYANLTKQLQGQQTMMNNGINANTAQATAMQGLAGQQGNMAAQQAATANSANSAWTDFLSGSIGSIGNIVGNAVGSSGTHGDTPTAYGSTYTPQQQDASMFMNGYNPYLGSSIQNNVG